ncbi:unnamed protein product [Nippostrongylus brasiliensis]|uniref:ERI1 exoribonuclease 3 (inferred by orthology to a human protein) n=1 Tax=Nippostrongylus brasiliensis TaxID=27835 RepID=A0A0N4XX84_NIPBR|nr:unnamed protein product [Nippostrongylus brasiliensis]
MCAAITARTAPLLLSKAFPQRCQNSLIASTSSLMKKSPPFVRKRGSSSVQTVSAKTPIMSPIRRKIVEQSTTSGQHAAQEFDYLLVLDFEATCSLYKIHPYQEIIEFPVAKVDTKTWSICSYFHHYVRPVANPTLSSFCTHLTGIIQEMVDDQPTIEEVLCSFDEWMKKEQILDSRFAFVTCGDWDLGVMLPSELQNKHLDMPSYFNRWINIKKSYCEHSGTWAKGLKDLLQIYGLQHAGRLHSGIDDVKTICSLTSAMAKEGYVFR